MAKARNKSWTEIIPEERLPALRWFYAGLLPSLLFLEPPFWHPDHEQLFRDWEYPPWLQYYEEFPEGYLELLCLALDLNHKSWPKSGEDTARWAFCLFEQLYKRADSLQSFDNLPAQVSEFALPRLLPLKLSQFVILNHLTCFVKYKASIPDLISAARSGDRDAMIKLVTIDHSFLELDVIRNHFRLATLVNKRAFLKPIARAIASPYAYGSLCEHVDELFIFLSWNLGFSQTGVEQFGFFLNAVGMKRFQSTSSLQRKLNRLGISTK